MDKEDTYRPLPTYMTIQPSKIEGLGLFTLKAIKDLETSLGVTHVWYEEVGSVFRTPLGGFINHSDEPNCELVEKDDDYHYKAIRTTKKIEAGEEITLKYSLYDICNYLCEKDTN